MTEMDIIEQVPLTMAELKDKLDLMKKDKEELNFRAEKVYAYLQEFVSIKKKDSDELRKKLSDLNIQRLRERHIAKIIDIMPENADHLKLLFAGEVISLKQDEIKQILDVING